MKRSHHFWGDMSSDSYPTLDTSLSTEALIVGGGIAGLNAVYTLLRLGVKDIALIEARTIGSGSTGHSAGMLVCEPEHGDWHELAEQFGIKNTRLFFNEQRKALTLVRRIIKQQNIDCSATANELLLLARTKGQRAKLAREVLVRNTIDKALLLQGAALCDELSIAGFSEASQVGDALSVNPLQFARGFGAYLARRGVRIFENSPEVKTRGNVVYTTSGRVGFSHLLRTTGTAEQHPKLTNYLTTIAVTRPLTVAERTTLGLIDNDMFVDDERRSFHYGKITTDNRLLIGYGDVATESVDTLQPLHQPHRRDINRFIKRAFPQLDLPIEHAWSATYALSKGLLPLVQIRNNRAVINGGGTQIGSMVAASYATHRLLGKPHPLTPLFDR